MSARRTFARRVARAMAATALLSGVLCAALSTAIAWASMLDREDARLRAAAHTLAVEIPAGAGDAEARHHADEERAEVAPAGLRIALYRSGRFVGGDPSLDPSPVEGCRTDARSRRCAVRAESGSIEVAGDLSSLRSERDLLLLASLLAAAFAGLGGVALSGLVSARIVRPLQRLREEVEAVDAEAPGATPLGAADGYAETDALRASLASMLARLDRALDHARRFAADAAHELRTPLGTMRAELELSAETRELPAEVGESQRRVLRTLDGMAGLVERLLILAASDESLRGGREAVSIEELAEELLASLDAEGRARVRVSVEAGLHVRGDAVLLRALMDNVVGNALKHAPSGEVTLRASADGGVARVAVGDEGPGVPVGERERVFDAFYRTGGARVDGPRGHGLGLALVARIARAHGGDAAFEDVPRGARLVLRLPLWIAR